MFNPPISEDEDSVSLTSYIKQSFKHKDSIEWFTCLISKKSDLEFYTTYIEKFLAPVVITSGVLKVGQKSRWMLAWKFN